VTFARVAQQSSPRSADEQIMGQTRVATAGRSPACSGARLRRGAALALAAALGAAVLVPASASATPGSHGGRGPAVRQLVLWQGTDALAALETAVVVAGASVVDRLPLARAVVVDAPRGWLPPAGAMAVPDRPLRVASAAYAAGEVPPLRATLGLAAEGTEGAGVTVALVDTGVTEVPELAGAVDHVNVSGAATGDGYGHGTFLAGLIAANGSSTGGRIRGVAPAARILDVQVAGQDGSTSLLRVLAGLEAVAERQEHDPTLRIVNLSLSSGSPLPPAADPLSRALEALWDRGLVVVVAAGNDGPARGSVTSPGTDPVVLTAGALDDHQTADRADDTVPAFSSYGRVRGASGRVTKPDVVAPGVSVVGLRSPGSLIDEANPGARVGSSHFRGSGTSMATAVTSGAVAAILAAEPDLEPDEVKDALTEAATDVAGRSFAAGAGAVDVPGALAAARASADETSSPHVVAAWERFAAAWADGSYDDAATAWHDLPAPLQRRAAHAWATAVASDGLVGPDEVELARLWAFSGGHRWLARAWSARAWSVDDWTARAWSARAWSARAWSARAWSARAWSARAWSARAWSARAWSARAWSARAWSGRAWSSDEWVARSWSGRAWSARAWSAQTWGDDAG
jgi:serine protease AprX